MNSVANRPFRLPCGLMLKNRLVKSAMSERLAVDGQPTSAHLRVFARWAQGGWGMLITGNIMIDERYLSGNGDVVVSSSDAATVEQWTKWTEAVKGHETILVAQLKVMFGTPREMTLAEIDDVIARFARAALIAHRAGFHGVEIHAGHGFLLSQFLSSSANTRSDEYGGSARKRAELVLRVIRAVRKEVPASFCVGVKINSADHMNVSGFEDMLEQVRLISKEQVDYIHLSGGSFEDPAMMSTSNSTSPNGPPSKRSQEREGFFLRASQEIRSRNQDLVLIVTGGFRSRKGINAALQSGACDLVGLGRPAVKYPDLPAKIMFNDRLYDEEARFDVESAPSLGWIATKIRSVGAGAETRYYTSLLRQI